MSSDDEEGETPPAPDAPADQVVEIKTTAGERLGIDLAESAWGGTEAKTNTIGVKVGSRLLSMDVVLPYPEHTDLRRTHPSKVAIMLREADGTITLTFSPPPRSQRSAWSARPGSARTSLLARLTGSRGKDTSPSLLADHD